MNFITFSRKMGTKGTEVAKIVAKELGYRFHDTEDIERKAQEMGFLDDIRTVDDKAPPPFKRFFSYRPEISLDRLHVVIYELARQGNAVILGRGGNMLFRSLPHTLHIRVIASQEKRVRNLIERGYTREAAVMVMEKSDHERESFIKFAFRRDWEDPELYDIVLNMNRLTVKSAVDMVLRAAQAEEFQGRSGDVTGSLDMMELAVRVGTALAEAGLPSTYISPSVLGQGKVRLTGVVQVPWEKSDAERIVREVEGVESVENDIEIASR
ncbi:MAG: cytidylate kinase [Syntrophorhabdaceae bacterium PtaU1.Bin034]|nr:MAG: cytidylate kinase [Syntrophorhabdaceae bacterium PtaU1.Bin034]